MAPKASGSKRQLAFIVSTHKYTLERLQRKAANVSELADHTIRTHLKELETVWSSIVHDFAPYIRGDAPPDGVTEEDILTSYQQVTHLHSEVRFIFLEQLAQTPESASVSQTTLLNQSQVTPAKVSLPKLPVPQFSGHFANWNDFFIQFNTLIHSNDQLNTIQKFLYLQSALSASAAEIISHLPLSEDNYAVALELLKRRYDNPRRLVTHHCAKLSELPSVRSTSLRDLRTFIDQFNAHFQALSTIPSINVFESIFVTQLMAKLETPLRTKFEETQLSTTFPQAKTLLEFLNNQATQLENVELTRPRSTPSSRATPSSRFNTTPLSSRRPTLSLLSTTPSCFNCNSSNHKIYSCPSFLKKTPRERSSFIKSLNRCLNCLAMHQSGACTSRGTCRVCNKPHHTLLHFGSTTAAPQPPFSSPSQLPSSASSSGVSQSQVSTITDQVSSFLSTSTTMPSTVLMATTLVRLQVSPSHYVVVRGVLDSASMASFITERCLRTLPCSRSNSSVPVSGIGCSKARSNGICSLSVASVNGQILSNNHPFIILSSITHNSPSRLISKDVRDKVRSVLLADPTFDQSSPIDCILGADITASVISGASYSLGKDLPFLVPTRFGHVIMGTAPSVPGSSLISSCCSTLPSVSLTTSVDDIHSLIQKFWKVEEPPNACTLSPQDQACEAHFVATTSRDSSGRYEVRLPFIHHPPLDLGDSFSTAVSRFRALERKFASNPQFHQSYTQFMRDYESQGHMKLSPVSAPHKYFIPHHGIFRTHGDTSKLRVVFDASARASKGLSLNDVLYSGPAMQNLLINVISLFRQHQWVFSCDIKQAYRQILVHVDDHPYQCIVWRETPSEELKVYHLTTVTYGVTSAPYLAIRTLVQLARDEGHHHPAAAHALLHNAFVDDIIAGGDTIDSAIHLKNDLIRLLLRGQFVLRKWAANDSRLLANIPSDHLLSSDSPSLNVLGIPWDLSTDSFTLFLSSQQSRPSGPQVHSKRSVITTIARIYDPCGWLAPVIMLAKSFLQSLWLHPLDWDSVLPQDLASTWEKLLGALQSAPSFSVPRSFSRESGPYQLHGFCDASKRGYAAVLYLKSIKCNSVSLLASKSRVAPLKMLSIPRLELQGAHLLAKLYCHFSSLFKDSNILTDPAYLWCDSSAVLTWIRTQPHTLQTFVANRVSEIQETTLSSMWRHVPSKDNPADIASRGMLPCELRQSSLWWTGPAWLTGPKDAWPRTKSPPPCQPVPELSLCLTSHASSPPQDDSLFNSISSWTRLLRVVSLIALWLPASAHASSHHSYAAATKLVCRYIQRCAFPTLALSHASLKTLPPALARLAPFVDESGLVRVGGRLKNADSVTTKHPILLPQHHHLVNLLIDHCHLEHGHAGPQFVQHQLGLQYWILCARRIIRHRIFLCVRCFRSRPVNVSPLMGQLPYPRVTPSLPFHHTGMDYAGPFRVRATALRKSSVLKSYLCIFICFSTKAVHMEVAADLTTDAFIDVLRRFVSRRGVPGCLYSDCGTNFVGANSRIQELFNTFLKQHSDIILHYAGTKGIVFNFLPPSAPHQGGLWERAVRSAKYHLTRVLGDMTPTLSQFSSLVVQIEAVLNSRPLTPMSADPHDLRVLTPAHFLIGRPITALPSSSQLTHQPSIVKHFEQVQALYLRFWDRWHREYLPSLQTRSKWIKPVRNLAPGDLVLIQEPNTPPLRWPLGRIEEVHPGSDGTVRRITVRTATGRFLRPAVKAYCLPFSL